MVVRLDWRAGRSAAGEEGTCCHVAGIWTRRFCDASSLASPVTYNSILVVRVDQDVDQRLLHILTGTEGDEATCKFVSLLLYKVLETCTSL